MLVAYILILKFECVHADPSCSKNAETVVCVNSVDGTNVRAKVYVVAGKDGNSIPEYTLKVAMDKFMGGTCTVDKNSGYMLCVTRDQWRFSNWSGYIDIEFACTNKLYKAYGADWKSRDYYCRNR
ncbi:hypothetical protein BCV72DRAFT_212828 [Rhizopus microsporus var. microsporus]|uniref:Uncharacterized protein n=1 Tax=Rhizopus microsporus var. microsporus TaxID=86635 RepID=A0A1X0QV78_RHIZD|nr:hypothetical protein BCV72DRAFT_212828 [Rhizopus microsporus var. microsporus]